MSENILKAIYFACVIIACAVLVWGTLQEAEAELQTPSNKVLYIERPPLKD